MLLHPQMESVHQRILVPGHSVKKKAKNQQKKQATRIEMDALRTINDTWWNFWLGFQIHGNAFRLSFTTDDEELIICNLGFTGSVPPLP